MSEYVPDKRSTLTKMRDIIGNWQWWATFAVSRANGASVKLAGDNADKAVKEIEVIKR